MNTETWKCQLGRNISANIEKTGFNANFPLVAGFSRKIILFRSKTQCAEAFFWTEQQKNLSHRNWLLLFERNPGTIKDIKHAC